MAKNKGKAAVADEAADAEQQDGNGEERPSKAAQAAAARRAAGEESEGEENAEDDAEDDHEAAAARQHQEDLAAERAERQRLQEENDRLRQESVGRPKVTAAQLRAIPEDDPRRAHIEGQTGLSFDEVVRNVEAQELRAGEERQLAVDAKLNVSDAIADAVDADPQLAKVKGHIREYLADFPDTMKADKRKMKDLMKKAVVYARGAAPAAVTRRAPTTTVRDPKPGDDGHGDEGGNDPKRGAIRAGTYQTGDLTLVIEDLVPKEKRERMKHPDNPNGIMIRADFDEAPRFR